MKIFPLVLSVTLCLFFSCAAQPAQSQPSRIWNGKADTKWYKDSESEFTIATPEQLAGLAKLVEGGNDFYGKTVRLGADIMLNDTADWQSWDKKAPKNKWKPIGIYIHSNNAPGFLHSHFGYYLIDALVPGFIQRALRLKETDLPFRGIFDGGGFAVSGVYINALESFQGLFGSVYKMRNEENVELRNLSVRASYIKGMGAVGGLVGGINGKVNGCYSIALVAGITAVGGLVGKFGDNIYYSDEIIINSYSAGIMSGDSIVGGLVGRNLGTIGNSYSASKVSGKTKAGGLAGFNYGIITNSYSTGAVYGDSIVGGLSGVSIGKITSSYSIGAVAGNSEAGGLVGRNQLWKKGIVNAD